MAVESPTGGPNDSVFNTNGLALLWCYAWERSYSGISLLCPWESSVRHSHALSLSKRCQGVACGLAYRVAKWAM